MKLTKEQREVLRQIGKQARKETEARPDYPEILDKMKAAAKHGKKRGRPPWKYPPCVNKETGKTKFMFSQSAEAPGLVVQICRVFLASDGSLIEHPSEGVRHIFERLQDFTHPEIQPGLLGPKASPEGRRPETS